MNQINLEPLISDFQGTPGIVVQPLAQKQYFQCNANLLFPAASLIKLSVLWEFFY